MSGDYLMTCPCGFRWVVKEEALKCPDCAETSLRMESVSLLCLPAFAPDLHVRIDLHGGSWVRVEVREGYPENHNPEAHVERNQTGVLTARELEEAVRATVSAARESERARIARVAAAMREGADDGPTEEDRAQIQAARDAGHTHHCAVRQVVGDGACECGRGDWR